MEEITETYRKAGEKNIAVQTRNTADVFMVKKRPQIIETVPSGMNPAS